MGGWMRTSTIAETKNNLSQLIYKLDEPVHITRHGKPVAVMISETQYQQMLTPKNNSLSDAIRQWRDGLTEDIALTESELDELRMSSGARYFSWDE
jgi:prevent-host-death family protein